MHPDVTQMRFVAPNTDVRLSDSKPLMIIHAFLQPAFMEQALLSVWNRSSGRIGGCHRTRYSHL
jgi:hypothetical protein